MTTHIEQASKYIPVEPRPRVGLDQKIAQSRQILDPYCRFDVKTDLTPDNFRLGVVPRISPYDEVYLPRDARLVSIPEELRDDLLKERSYDLIRWNNPDAFLTRLRISSEPFKAPAEGKSKVMKRLKKKRKVVAFDNLRIDSPEPNGLRQSRSDIDAKMEVNIMGQARIPFALGSVPDVGSFLSYATIAQANGMALISRDKYLSSIEEQSKLAGEVIGYLRSLKLDEIPPLRPNEEQLKEFAKIKKIKRASGKKLRNKYYKALTESWVSNVGAAIEATPKGIERAVSLYQEGCKLFRIYSPEGGSEIIDTIDGLKGVFGEDGDIKIIAGQIMDLKTAKKAQKAGADAIMIGVAGGSQCTTSVNADIPVKTPNLLHELRGKVKIPIGVEGGGVGTHIMTAFALGASFVSKPGEMGVSFEGSGGKYMFQDTQGEYYMIYGGEASVSAKWYKDSLDDLGRPRFVEGETNVRRVEKDRLSMTRNINGLRHTLSVGLVFQRAETIAELHARNCHNIVEVTKDASDKSRAYGN